MSTTYGSTARPPSRAARGFGALVCFGLAVAAVMNFARDRSERVRSDAFVKRFALEVRRPEEIGAMKLEPEPDLAAGIAIRAALWDSAASLPALPDAGAREDEVGAARDLALDVAATRPGWAYHRFLLGELAYPGSGPARNAAAPEAWEKWSTPMRLAASEAPGLDDIWSAFARMYVDNWQKLSAAQKTEAVPVLQRALQDSGFVSARFLALSTAVGRDVAMGLLPENPELLDSAADSFSADGDLAEAAALLARRDTAQRARRAADLARVEGRFRARDENGLRAACAEWAAQHPPSELDDPDGRAQAASILELWPGDQGGPWEGDPRADLVRFFLDGRESAIPPVTLLRTLDALSDVPDAVKARVRLLAGDLAGAQDLANRPQNQGAPEWTLYYADLARLFIKQGRARDARGALDLVSLATRDGCDALLARREVARALEDTAELAAIGQRLSSLRGAVRPPESLPEGARLWVCIDPEQPGNLDVRLVPQGPAVVRYGWGVGRGGLLYLGGERSVSHPLEGGSGWRSLTVQSVTGPPARVSASLSASR